MFFSSRYSLGVPITSVGSAAVTPGRPGIPGTRGRPVGSKPGRRRGLADRRPSAGGMPVGEGSTGAAPSALEEQRRKGGAEREGRSTECGKQLASSKERKRETRQF